jgi:hypothetical protein
MHGAMPESPRMDVVARSAADHAIALVHHIENLVGILTHSRYLEPAC